MKLNEAATALSGELNSDSTWREILTTNSNWAKDPVFSNYHMISNKHKGKAGEYYTQKILEKLGHTVTLPTNSDHDRIVGGVKTEIKFSLACSKNNVILQDKFMINHVAISKDWDRLVFVGKNPKQHWANIKKDNRLPYEETRMYFMTKQDLSLIHISEPTRPY